MRNSPSPSFPLSSRLLSSPPLPSTDNSTRPSIADARANPSIAKQHWWLFNAMLKGEFGARTKVHELLDPWLAESGRGSLVDLIPNGNVDALAVSELAMILGQTPSLNKTKAKAWMQVSACAMRALQ